MWLINSMSAKIYVWHEEEKLIHMQTSAANMMKTTKSQCMPSMIRPWWTMEEEGKYIVRNIRIVIFMKGYIFSAPGNLYPVGQSRGSLKLISHILPRDPGTMDIDVLVTKSKLLIRLNEVQWWNVLCGVTTNSSQERNAANYRTRASSVLYTMESSRSQALASAASLLQIHRTTSTRTLEAKPWVLLGIRVTSVMAGI